MDFGFDELLVAPPTAGELRELAWVPLLTAAAAEPTVGTETMMYAGIGGRDYEENGVERIEMRDRGRFIGMWRATSSYLVPDRMCQGTAGIAAQYAIDGVPIVKETASNFDRGSIDNREFAEGSWKGLFVLK